MPFPETCTAFLAAGDAVRERLRRFKQQNPIPDYGWYLYESLSALPVIAEMLSPAYGEIADACRTDGVADIGCADGDFAVLFANCGAPVDAIDHRESNHNQMRGVDTAARAFGPEIGVYDVDLDGRFELPRPDYGLALFLGTLYHLKNPFYALEKVARASDWCVLSTRIARRTPAGTAIEEEPVAYLLGAREANNDPTNFWIFSHAGLLRTLERAGWRAVAEKRLGSVEESDPVRKDERIFVLLKSRVRFPELQVRLLEGWHPAEPGGWRWTAKRFALEAILPESEPAREFALRLTIPEAVAAGGAVGVACTIGGEPAGTLQVNRPETIEFRGAFPESARPGGVLRLEFEVESEFAPGTGDLRELGVVVPAGDRTRGNHTGIPFRIS